MPTAAAAWHGSPAPDGNGNGTWYFQPAVSPQQGAAAANGYPVNGLPPNGYAHSEPGGAPVTALNGQGGTQQYPAQLAVGYQQMQPGPQLQPGQQVQPGPQPQPGQQVQPGQPAQLQQAQPAPVMPAATLPMNLAAAPAAPVQSPSQQAAPQQTGPQQALQQQTGPQAALPPQPGPQQAPQQQTGPQQALQQQTGPQAMLPVLTGPQQAAPPVLTGPQQALPPAEPAAAAAAAGPAVDGLAGPSGPAAPPAPVPQADPPAYSGLTGGGAHSGLSGGGPLSKLTGAVRGRRGARKPRLAMSAIFADLVDMADIPRSAYAVDEEVTGAMCLFKTDGGYEVFSCAEDARHEVRFFEEEEAAYFYLFGVLAAESLRNGRLTPRRG
ncbi:MAG TPA: hypothetical protein VGD91_01985 [Trebonia sp.]